MASHTADDSDSDDDANSHVRGTKGFRRCKGSWAFRLTTPSADSTKVALGMCNDDVTSQKAASVGHWALGLDTVIVYVCILLRCCSTQMCQYRCLCLCLCWCRCPCPKGKFSIDAWLKLVGSLSGGPRFYCWITSAGPVFGLHRVCAFF